MDVVKDTSSESGERAFEVSFTLWGTERKPARKQKCIVMALTRRGVRRILKSRFPRSGNYEIAEQRSTRL